MWSSLSAPVRPGVCEGLSVLRPTDPVGSCSQCWVIWFEHLGRSHRCRTLHGSGKWIRRSGHLYRRLQSNQRGSPLQHVVRHPGILRAVLYERVDNHNHNNGKSSARIPRVATKWRQWNSKCNNNTHSLSLRWNDGRRPSLRALGRTDIFPRKRGCKTNSSAKWCSSWARGFPQWRHRSCP